MSFFVGENRSRQKWQPCQDRLKTFIILALISICEEQSTAHRQHVNNMSELEQALKKIDFKFRLLEFPRDDVPRIQEKKDLKATERLQKTLEKQIDSVHEQMVEIQALRIEKGEEPNDVRKWSLKIEKQVADYEEITQGVRKSVKNLREEVSREAKLEEEKAEEEKRKQQHEEELKLEEVKMQIKRDFRRTWKKSGTSP